MLVLKKYPVKLETNYNILKFCVGGVVSLQPIS